MFELSKDQKKVSAHLSFVHTTDCREFVSKLCKLNLTYPVEVNFVVRPNNKDVSITMPVDDDNRDNLDNMVAHLIQLIHEYHEAH